MKFTCKTCGNEFTKKRTLKLKHDRAKIQFCGEDCARAYSLVKITKLNKKRNGKKIPQSSKEEIDFGNILQSYFPNLQRQYQLKDYYHRYDFYIPELALLVEYNGTYWHNMPKVRISDRMHLKEATKRNVPLAIVTDVEWKIFIKSGLPNLKKVKKLLNHVTKNFKK